MNQLITTYNGGFPFQLDDLRFLDSAQREAFLGVIKALVGYKTGAVISGCEIMSNDGTNIHIADGYVFLSNEIFYAPAQDIPVLSSGAYYWVIATSYDASGDKNFDGLVKHTYEIRQAKCQAFDTPPTDGLLLDDDGWVSVALTSFNVSLFNATFSNVNGTLKYKIINSMAFVMIYLSINIATADASSVGITISLPSELFTVDQGGATHGFDAFGTGIHDDMTKNSCALILKQAGLVIEKDNGSTAFATGYHSFSGQLFGGYRR